MTKQAFKIVPSTSPEAIIAERKTQHGSFMTNAIISQRLKQTLRCMSGWENLDDDQKESIDMICLKISRILSGKPHFIDHWDDIAGYAVLIAKRLREAEEKAKS